MDAFRWCLAKSGTDRCITLVSFDSELTLTPGLYKSSGSLEISSGDLTFDAKGDANAVFILQIASTLTTTSERKVILSGGAQAKNVFWQVGRSAVIGDYTLFKGTVMALTSITMGSGATTVGRMLARNGAVVLTSTNIINKP
ncbi:MAG: ice-binding family protein [Bacteroidales bacterium]|nr:ice-binding family protein [Bacteroidales bacterium]